MPVSTNQGFKSLICGDSVANEFLYYHLLTLKGRMTRVGTGSTFLEVSKRDVANINVALPPLFEQRAIAAVLSDIDELIQSLEDLIAKKRSIKRAAMQQLLTGSTRLPGFGGEWRDRRVGDIALIHRDHLMPSADGRTRRYAHYSVPAYDAGARPLRQFGAEIGSAKFRVPPGAVLVCRLNPRIARVWAPEGTGPDEAVASTEFFVLTPRTAVNRDFLYHLLCLSSRFWHDMMNAVTGSTGSHQRVHRDSAMSIVVVFPDDESEQRAIATILSDMDAEIAALEARLAKTRAIKQGAMQQLLTGATRLPIPEDPSKDTHHDA